MNIFSTAFHFIVSMARLQWFKFRGFEPIADPARQGIRYLYCQCCPENKNEVCRVCKCLIHAKISLNSESCPLKYWPAMKIKKNAV